MNPDKLSKLFFIACSRSQEVLSELYEDLHDDSGEPLMGSEEEWFKTRVQSAIKEIRTELSLISSAIKE